MRRLLTEALEFPRKYLRSNMYLCDCRHGGNFRSDDQYCETCLQKELCHWLYLNDECTTPETKSVAELVRALEIPLDHIDTNIAYAGHNIGTCTCAACLWLKNAENLLSLYQRTNSSMR